MRAGSARQWPADRPPRVGGALTGASSGARHSGVFGSGLERVSTRFAICDKVRLAPVGVRSIWIPQGARTRLPPKCLAEASRIDLHPGVSRVRGRFLSCAPLCGVVLSAPALSETRTEGGYRTCSIARSTARTIGRVRLPRRGNPNGVRVVRRCRPTPRRQSSTTIPGGPGSWRADLASTEARRGAKYGTYVQSEGTAKEPPALRSHGMAIAVWAKWRRGVGRQARQSGGEL